MPTRAEAPVLEGWLSLPEAADRLGYTRAGIHYVADGGKIETLRRVPGDRARYLMREAELPALADRLGLEVVVPPNPLAKGRWRIPDRRKVVTAS